MRTDRKAKENWQAALHAFEGGFYDTAISRGYYSYFHHLLYWAKLPKHMAYFGTEATQHNSHKGLPRAFFADLQRRQSTLNYGEILLMMDDVRAARKTADYQDASATRLQAQRILTKLKLLIELLASEYDEQDNATTPQV